MNRAPIAVSAVANSPIVSAIGRCLLIQGQTQRQLWQDLSLEPDPFAPVNNMADVSLNCLTVSHSTIDDIKTLPYQIESLFVKIDFLELSEIVNALNKARDLVTSGKVKSLGLHSERSFEDHNRQSLLPDLFSVLQDERLDRFCRALRAPLNLFESNLLRNGSLDFAKSNCLFVVAERALMMRLRTDSNSKSYSLLRSVSSHSDLELIRPLKLALNNVIHLEKRAEDAGIQLPWGRRIASNQGQLMNLYAWNRALQSKILPGLEDCLKKLRDRDDRQSWSDHYQESFNALLDRMTLAVEHAAFHENEAIMSVLHDIGGYDPSLTIEDTVSMILQQAGANVVFSPGAALSINEEVPERSREEINRLFDHISQMRFYFETSFAPTTLSITA